MRRWIQIITVICLVKPFLKFNYIFKSYGTIPDKNISGPLIIITNHKTFFDSFTFGAAIKPTSKMFPVRFMGEVDQFNHSTLEFFRKIGLIKLAYLIFGVVPAIRGVGLNKALEKPVSIIKRGGTFLIHPEGRVIKDDKIGDFKRGAAALALKTNAPILPAAFKLRAGKYSINFGKIFNLPQNISYEEGADIIRGKICELYNKIK